MINFQYNSNIKNIVINATTAESCSLKFKEQKKIIKFVYKKFKNKIGIIVGSCHNSYEKAKKVIDFAKKKKKIKGFLQIIPYYIKPTEKGIVNFFKKVCKRTKKPIILYNVPGRTNFNINIKTLKKIFKIKNLVGIKESSTDLKDVIKKIILCKKKKKKFFFGDDLMSIMLDKRFKVSGNISVISNIIPKRINKKTSCFSELKKIIKAINSLFIETNPSPIKYIMSKYGIIKNNIRTPLCMPNKKNRKKILKAFIKIKKIKK